MGIAARAGHPRVGLGVGTRLCAGSIVLLPFVGLLGARRVGVWGQPCPGTALFGDGVTRSSAQQVLRVLTEVLYPNYLGGLPAQLQREVSGGCLSEVGREGSITLLDSE